jgi:hypothetical protein
MQPEDATPELLAETQVQHTRKTVELCGAENGRQRCTRNKGHDGQHEALALDGPLLW